MKEIEKDKNKLKGIPFSEIGRISNVKIATLSKNIYRFSAIPAKIPKEFFIEIEKNSLKIRMKQ